MYFTSCTNVYLMALISLERYLILKNKIAINNLKLSLLVRSLFTSVALGLFWSVMPLLGWSRYTLEDSAISCSIDWKERSLNVISYNVAIFIFVFILPFGTVIYTNIKIILLVRDFFKLSIYFLNYFLIIV